MKVLWFNCDTYYRVDLDNMTDKEKFEVALSDDTNVSIWDDIKSFEQDLNDGCVSIDDGFVYFVE